MTSHPEIDGREFVSTFVTLADTLVDEFDVIELLHLLASRVVDFTSADEVGILLLDEADSLQCLAASSERTRLLELFQIQNSDGPCRDCVASGEPVEVLDLATDRDRWPLFAPEALDVGFRSVQAVPLRLRGQVLGAMNLFCNQTGGIGSSGRLVAQAMADVATIGLLQQRELFQAQTVAGQLQQALRSRVAIEQAKGVIAEQGKIEMDDAFDLLRRYARNNNQTLGTVVKQVIDHSVNLVELTRQ
ncbi:MAG: GAF and ANTAR domain-containing protein [Nitriliruptoraceae bacterium]